jgi:hypothetical protein
MHLGKSAGIQVGSDRPLTFEAAQVDAFHLTATDIDGLA